MAHLLKKHLDSINPFSDEEFEQILAHFEFKKFKKHSFLVQEDNYVKYEYFILKGCVKSFKTDKESGNDFIYQFGIEDWWVTDREAFFKGTKATINIDCLEDCEVLALTLDNREKLGKAIWKYEHFLSVKANFGYISLQKRLLTMIMGSAKERYEDFMHQYPQLMNRIPKMFIASYLGISRETLSRLYKPKN